MKIRNARWAPGLTLVELMVAVAIMVIIIAGIGYVFSATSKTVRAARTNNEINGSMRAMSMQLRDDLRKLDKDGFMAIVGATDNTPAMLIFTATGRFEPIRVPTAWTGTSMVADDTTNSAVIMYVTMKDGDKMALGRYVYRLVGRHSHTGSFSSWPDRQIFIGEQMMRVPGTTTAAKMAYCDAMFATMRDVELLPTGNDFAPPTDPAQWGGSNLNTDFYGNIFDGFVYPFLFAFSMPNRYGEFNADPATLSEVEDLWPYLLGGLTDSSTAMVVEFNDGNTATTGTFDPLGHPNDPTEDYWFDPVSDITDLTGSFRNDEPRSVADTFTVNGNIVPFVIWTGHNQDIWPTMLRFKLKLTDVAGTRADPTDANFELILPVQ